MSEREVQVHAQPREIVLVQLGGVVRTELVGSGL